MVVLCADGAVVTFEDKVPGRFEAGDTYPIVDDGERPIGIVECLKVDGRVVTVRLPRIAGSNPSVLGIPIVDILGNLRRT
jgi:hypothetical protein